MSQQSNQQLEKELKEMKLEMTNLETKNQMLEVANKHLEQKLSIIEEREYTKVENEMREKSLEKRLKESEQKLEKITKEMAILKAKNQTLTEKNKTFEEKLEEAEHMFKMEEAKRKAGEEHANEIAKLKPLSHRRRLPLELECEIFKYLKMKIQQKFICGLGRGIYEIFGHKLLAKSKRLRNPKVNSWSRSKCKKFAIMSPDGLKVCNRYGFKPMIVSANKGFPISIKNSRIDHFPGTIMYYFEVTLRSFSSPGWELRIGLSDGSGFDDLGVGVNSYAFVISSTHCHCSISGTRHSLELEECPNCAIRPTVWEYGNVIGCGLLLDPKNGMVIFFTVNGKILGKKIPIRPSRSFLYPTVHMDNISLEANFGNDPAKPFKYDVKKCQKKINSDLL